MARNIPIHLHDCKKCTYLGTTTHGYAYYDWYHCADDRGGSLIRRYGNEGREYWSAPLAMLPTMLEK